MTWFGRLIDLVGRWLGAARAAHASAGIAGALLGLCGHLIEQAHGLSSGHQNKQSHNYQVESKFCGSIGLLRIKIKEISATM